VLAQFEPGRSKRRTAWLGELVLFELAEAEDSTTFMPMPVESRAGRVADPILRDPTLERDETKR
jgi:hypothetical protein